MDSTPILDLEAPAPKPRGSWLAYSIGAVIGLFLALLLIANDQNELPHLNWPVCNGLLLLPALYVAIAIHELGHLAAAAMTGMDFGGISVGPFTFMKSGRNWVYRFDRKVLFGGFFQPLMGAGFDRAACAWMVAGGPIASVLLTVVCAVAGNGLWNWIGTLFWVSLFIALISAIPFSAGLNKSDGGRIWQLLRHPAQARCWMALIEMQTEESKGVRPRDWNAGLFTQVVNVDASAGEYAYCQLMAYYRRLDEGVDAAALSHLENALAKSLRAGKPFRHALFLEAASSSALIRKRAAQARTWLDRACKIRKPRSLNVLEAGIAMCEGRYEEATKFWDAAKADVARLRLDSGLIRFAKEKWEAYESECLGVLRQ